MPRTGAGGRAVERFPGAHSNTHDEPAPGRAPGGGTLTRWHLPVTGLQTAHHYARVIDSPDDGYGLSKPFYRQCFLTDRAPNS